MEGFMVTTSVTILMAVYNSPLGMLDEAIESILTQTFRDFEFLIVDDGSTDPDVTAHLKWRASRDARIRIAREPHRGLTASLNRGLTLASGAFIARQDADDWSAPERLERQLAHFAKYPGDVVCGSNALTHQENGRPLWSTNLPLSHAALLAAFPNGNPFVHGSVMFRKEEALAAGGYREAFRCSQDYDFFWRLAERHGAANLAELLYHYRYTSGSISASRAAEQLRAHQAIRNLAESRRQGEPENPAAALAQATTELDVFRALLKQADHLMLAGDYRKAAKSYFQILAGHPHSPIAWAKFVRLALFRSVPCLREVSFR
jgi:glycosyltransferase involved in cell wall biosynthesis